MTLGRLIFLWVLLRQECASHLLEWLGWSSPPQFISSGTPLLDIPFEELGPEDKFLVEASRITDLKLSQLDVCQHKIVMKIKASCGALSDEDIAKLSVNLLNCQADVEGRKTFPCTEEMSLKACTKNMDAEMWNAYHIMSNRARAVCYAARQEEFRALAEMTINRLLATARTHVEQMAALQDKQAKLEKITQFALGRISQSNHDVLSSYSRLRRLESGLGTKLEEDKSNLEAIGNFVSKEAESIENVFKDFKNSLDDAGKTFKNKKKDESAEHEKLMNRLGDSLKLGDTIINKLIEVSSLLDTYNAQYSSYSKDLFSDLKAVSKSLSVISSSADALQQLTEQKVSLVSSLIGESGEKLDEAVFLSIHLLCLLVAMVLCSFLEFPRRLRVLVVTAGILNTYCSVHSLPYCLRLLDLYLSLAGAVIEPLSISVYSCITVIFFLVDSTIVQIFKVLNKKKVKAKGMLVNPQGNRYNLQDRELNGFKKPLSKVDEWLTEKFSDRDSFVIRNGMLPSMTPLSKDAPLGQDDQISLPSRRSARNHKSASPSSSIAGSSTSGRKIMCSAVRPNGQRCRLPAKSGQQLCRIHENIR